MNRNHSRPGIASFCTIIIAIISYIVQAVGVGSWYQFELYRKIELPWIYLNLGLSFIALILGLWGISENNRRKEFAISGIFLSIFTVIAFCGYVILTSSYIRDQLQNQVNTRLDRIIETENKIYHNERKSRKLPNPIRYQRQYNFY